MTAEYWLWGIICLTIPDPERDAGWPSPGGGVGAAGGRGGQGAQRTRRQGHHTGHHQEAQVGLEPNTCERQETSSLSTLRHFC